MQMIQMKDLSFRYEKSDIIHHLNISVEKGQVYCLFGPNGCGKSTLIQCMLGILEPYEGTIVLNEQHINRLSPKAIGRHVAYIPQVHEKPFPFKVIDIVLMGRTAHGDFFAALKKEDYDRCYAALKRVGMYEYREKPYTQLSGGQTQLVLVARALTQETPILIMDEPTAHLDFRHELRFLEIITDLMEKEQLTVVMATHFPNHAFYFENQGLDVKVALMNDRKIYVEGRPSHVLTEENMKKVFHIHSMLISK